MNLDRGRSLSLVQGLVESLRNTSNVDVAVCPPSVYLGELGKALHGSNIGLGAQNAYNQPEGAYTGEVSCGMLKDVGCQYVILGHSERRAIFGETDLMVNEKLHAVLAAGLTGKTATPAQAEEVHKDIRELLGSLFSSETSQKVIILYGGSVKADNALELLSEPNIDGALVGGASLKQDSFLGIVQAASSVKK